MSTSDTKQKIESLLTDAFAPTFLEIEDESHKHAGHAGVKERGGGHFRVWLESASLEGMSRLERQRAVYKAVDDLFVAREIHALRLVFGVRGKV